MNLKGIQVITKQTGDFVVKNSPTILTSLAVGGLVGTAAMAVDATVRSLESIETERLQREKLAAKENGSALNFDERDAARRLTKMEIVKISWKHYLPMAGMGLTTIACIIGANHINLRRNAALVSLYTLAERTFDEYQKKVVETLGEKKEEKLRESIVQDKLNKNPLSDSQVIITGKGETLFYDSLSGRYFKSDIETVRRIQNDFNEQLIGEMYGTLNEFYDELGLEHTVMGNDMGWAVEYSQLHITFSAKITPDGQPCIVIEYRYPPRKL
jgi:hypothetical protein